MLLFIVFLAVVAGIVAVYWLSSAGIEVLAAPFRSRSENREYLTSRLYVVTTAPADRVQQALVKSMSAMPRAVGELDLNFHDYNYTCIISTLRTGIVRIRIQHVGEVPASEDVAVRGSVLRAVRVLDGKARLRP